MVAEFLYHRHIMFANVSHFFFLNFDLWIIFASSISKYMRNFKFLDNNSLETIGLCHRRRTRQTIIAIFGREP